MLRICGDLQGNDDMTADNEHVKLQSGNSNNKQQKQVTLPSVRKWFGLDRSMTSELKEDQ